MELLSVQRARSVWLLDSNDLNPRGRSIGTDLFEWIKDAYHFEKFPSSVNDLNDSKALYFGGGKFRLREEGSLVQTLGEEIIVELRVYNDGIVGDTRSSSKDTDAFLSDVLQSGSREFGLSYTPALIRRKLYRSELNVRTDKNLMSLNPKLTQFAQKLSGVLGAKSPVELTGVAFWPDVLPKPDQSIFRFERKWGFEFRENRYLATASLQTEKHLEMLTELEQVLSLVET